MASYFGWGSFFEKIPECPQNCVKTPTKNVNKKNRIKNLGKSKFAASNEYW